MEDIVQYTNDQDGVLRKKAKEVPIQEIPEPKIQTIIKNMKEALKSQHDGVAIAAPQIGEALRIFVVSGRIFENSDHKDLVFINPKIINLSKETEEMEEGCLSVRWLYGKVKRHSKASVEAYDEKGTRFVRGGSDLLAQIFQHEIDHLDGVLFIDKAKDVKEYEPEEKS